METTTANGNGNKICELDQHMWSVVTKVGIFARGCTYKQARQLADNWFESYQDFGVAVITDEAAKRFRYKPKPEAFEIASPDATGCP